MNVYCHHADAGLVVGLHEPAAADVEDLANLREGDGGDRVWRKEGGVSLRSVGRRTEKCNLLDQLRSARVFVGSKLGPPLH